MFSKLGIYSLLVGLFLGLFNGISVFMGVNNLWVGLTLSKLLGTQRTESIITSFGSDAIQNALDGFLYDTPLFAVILGLGVIFLVISLFMKEHK